MITFCTTTTGRELHRYYLNKRGRSISPRIDLVSYGELPKLGSIPAGVTIFAAIDQLSPRQREAVTEFWGQLKQSGQRVLNHPKRSWRRYPLLSNLYEMGRNRFQVYRADEVWKVETFPVFVREADQHNGNLTPLINTRSALQHALYGLTARGYRTKNLIIEEFCDTKDAFGLIRKYSAFKVGDFVLAKNLMFSTHWMVKNHFTLTDAESSQELVQEQQEYIHTNPHEEWIRDVFELAGISFGRIDYGFYQGAPQVWEVNTDPTLQSRPAAQRRPGRERYRAMRKRGQDLFHERFRAALCELDGATTEVRKTPIRLDAQLVQQLRAEERREKVRRTIHRSVKSVVATLFLQRMKPWLIPLATRVAKRLSQISPLKPR